MKNLFKVLILTLLFASSTFATAKNQMIMITDKNCIFCIAWEKEIGEIYPKSDIGKKYPIIRIEIKDIKQSDQIKYEKVKVTPTFIFLSNNKEKGRIYGFSNPEMFWWRIDEILGIN